MNRVVMMMLLAVMGLVVAACSGPEDRTAEGTYPPPPPGVLRINVGPEPPTLDPHLCTDIPSFNVINQLFDPLVRMDANGGPIPAGAVSWEHDGTYTTWTFKLRPEQRWHNGDPVVAQDYVNGMRRILTPGTQAQYAMMVFNFLDGGKEFYDSDGADDANFGARAIDDHTLEIRLAAPAPYFISILDHSAWYPAHMPTIDQHGSDWIRVGNYNGTGPYRLADYRSKDRIVLRKVDGYWDPEVHFDEIVFLMIEEESTELAAFMAGDLDITGQMSHREAPRWFDRPEFSRGPMIGMEYVGFNMTRPPFDNIHLRKAFAHAINRRGLAEHVVGRGESPAVGFIPRGIVMHDGKDYRDHAPVFYDPDDAEGLRAKALEHLRAGGFRVPGESEGTPVPRVEYIFNTLDVNRDVAQRYQNDWETVLGVRVGVSNMEWAVLLSRLTAKNFQMGRGSWIGDYLDPLTFLEIFETGHGKNNVGYSNPRYDELLAMARTETDPAKRLEYFIEAETLIVEVDCVVAPVYERVTPVLQRPEIRGVIRTPLAGLDVTRAWREGEK